MSLVYALNYPPGEIIIKENLFIDRGKLPRFRLSEAGRRDIWNKLGNLNTQIKDQTKDEIKIVIFPPKTGEWMPFREWPLEYFARLGKRLLEEDKNLYIVITGTRSASASAEQLLSAMGNHPRCIDLTGKTTLKELIDLYNISSILVSVDSGPAHFASLTDIKAITIFGPDTPRVFAPLGENCICLTPELSCHPCFSVFNGRKANCRDKVKPCLLNVTPEKVYMIVKERLYVP